MNRFVPAILISTLMLLPGALGGSTTYSEDYVLGTNGASYGEECGNVNLDVNVAGVCFNLGGAGVNRTAAITVDDDFTENVILRIQFGVYVNGVLHVQPAAFPLGSLIHSCGSWSGAVPDWAEGVKVAIYNDGLTQFNPAYDGCEAGVAGTVTLVLTEP